MLSLDEELILFLLYKIKFLIKLTIQLIFFEVLFSSFYFLLYVSEAKLKSRLFKF